MKALPGKGRKHYLEKEATSVYTNRNTFYKENLEAFFGKYSTESHKLLYNVQFQCMYVYLLTMHEHKIQYK